MSNKFRSSFYIHWQRLLEQPRSSETYVSWVCPIKTLQVAFNIWTQRRKFRQEHTRFLALNVWLLRQILIDKADLWLVLVVGWVCTSGPWSKQVRNKRVSWNLGNWHKTSSVHCSSQTICRTTNILRNPDGRARSVNFGWLFHRVLTNRTKGLKKVYFLTQTMQTVESNWFE